jgi:hypothetical protein
MDKIKARIQQRIQELEKGLQKALDMAGQNGEVGVNLAAERRHAAIGELNLLLGYIEAKGV